jgi:CBS domain containing-hemolysin-like protein
MMEHQFVLLSLAFLLVLLNGFFVAAEFAIVKLRAAQTERLAGRHRLRGRVLQNVHAHLDTYLSVCQLGITLASLGLGWIGEPAVARLLESWLHLSDFIPANAVHGISFAVAFFVISYLHIVLGELAPKSMAIRRAEELALWTAPPLYLFYRVMQPFIWLLNGSALLLLRAMGFDLTRAGEGAYSAEELKQLLAASHLHGELGAEEADILQPATRMVSLDVQANVADNLRTINRHRFSRYPVCDGTIDRIIGIAHIKDLFAAMREGSDLGDLRPQLRKALIVHDKTPAFELFRLFREGYPHIAVVDDEVGNVLGFITLEDLLETLFGHIQDEFRRSKDDWLQLRDGSLLGSGTLSLYSLEKLLGVSIASEESHTIGGLVMETLDHVPRRGERVEFDDFEVLIGRMRGPVIAQLQVFPKQKAASH